MVVISNKRIFVPKPAYCMETTAKPMTGIEKLRKLVAVKEEAQRDARWRYKNDPEYRAVFDRLEQKNVQNCDPNQV